MMGDLNVSPHVPHTLASSMFDAPPHMGGGGGPEPGAPSGIVAHGSYKGEEDTAAGGGGEKISFVFPCFWLG